jgi:RHS repeat-associated protein
MGQGINQGNGQVTLYTGNAIGPIDGALSPAENPGGGNRSQRWCMCAQRSAADPVNTASGNFFEHYTDLTVTDRGLPMDLERTYNSQLAAVGGPLGYGWSFSFGMSLSADPNSGVVTIGQEEGSQVVFTPVNGAYTAPPRVQATLTHNGDGTYTFTRQQRTRFTFDASGRLTAESDLDGNVLTGSYGTDGHLASMTDSSGRAMTFTSTASGLISSATSPGGKKVSYEYDKDGNLGSVTDASGGVTTFGYDGSHRMTSVITPVQSAQTDPKSTNIIYDTTGRVVSQTDPEGHETAFSYSGNPSTPSGGTTTITDPVGVVTTDNYNHGLLTSTTVGSGDDAATTTYTYDPVSLGVTAMTDATGRTWTYTYNAAGNRTSQTDPAGNVTTWQYDSLDDVTATTDPNGVTTAYSYDVRGHRTGSATPVGGTTATTADGYGDPAHPGDLTSTTDADGRTTQYGYDARGDRVKSTDPGGNATTFAFNVDGWVTATTAANGNVAGADPADYRTTFAYDANGRLTATTDPLGHVIRYGYDRNGNRTSVTDPTGRTTGQSYDAADRPVTLTNPEGATTTYAYDAAGRRITSADGADHTIKWEYDSRGDVTAVTDQNGKTTRIIHDRAHRLLVTTSPNGGTATNSYDVAGRLSKTFTAPDGGTTSYGYDRAGRITAVTDPDGNATTTAYDNLGRPVRTTLADGTVTTSTFDLAGQLMNYTDAAVHTTTYGYDPSGRRTSSTDPDQHTTTLGYDATGNRTTVTDPQQRTAVTTYDAAGEVTAVSYSDGITQGVAYTYDAAGRRLTRDDGTGTATYDYDSAGRPTSVTDGHGATVGYDYNDLGQISRVTYPDGRESGRSYDPIGRLSRLSDGLGNQVAFGYDGNGNLTTIASPGDVVDTAAFDSTDEVTGVTTQTGTETAATFAYSLTASGRLATNTDSIAGTTAAPVTYTALQQTATVGGGSYTFDAAGNLTATPDGATLTYDPAGQLVSRTPSSGTATAYAFDASGRRTSSTVGGNTTTYTYDQADHLSAFSGAGTSETFTYDGDGLRAATTTSSGTLEETWDDVSGPWALLLDDGTNDYLYGPDGRPVEQIDHSTGEATFLHADRVGSIRTLTNTSGAVVGTATFDAYGELTAASGDRSRMGFTGAYTDPTGLIYLRARYYDPATAQFLTVDPMVDDTRAAYAYAEGDPLNRTDPTGLWTLRGALSTGLAGVSTVTGMLAIGLAVTGGGGAVMEGISIVTGGLATILDCSSAGWNVQCAVGLGAFVLGAAGGAARMANRWERMGKEAADNADIFFGVHANALGFVATVNGMSEGMRGGHSEGSGLALAARIRALNGAALRCRT